MNLCTFCRYGFTITRVKFNFPQEHGYYRRCTNFFSDNEKMIYLFYLTKLVTGTINCSNCS